MEEMTLNEKITIAALILGPALAVAVQLLVQYLREPRDRRINVFRTLMSTRGSRLDQQHVGALNLVPFEFRGNRQVIERWRAYLACLQDMSTVERVKAAEDCLVELLEQMGRSLSIPFQMHEIRREHYLPKLYADANEEWNQIRRLMLSVLQSDALPVRIVAEPPPPQKAIQISAPLGRSIQIPKIDAP